MSNIEQLRKAEYDHALSLQLDGDTDAAHAILCDLLLKVDLSIYRRALVNITLAAMLRTQDRDKYARECLDLLDLLRQQHADHTGIEEELEHISDLENTARGMIGNISTPSVQVRPNPDTGLLSEASEPERDPSPTKRVSAGLQHLSLTQQHDATDVDDDLDSDDDEGKIVWEGEYTPLEKAPKDLPYIEGFLRDSYYTPFNSGQSSSSMTTTTAAAVPTSASTPIPQVYRDLTPASSSPTRQPRHQE